MALAGKIEEIVVPALNRFGVELVMGSFRREKSGKVLRLLIERKGASPEAGSGVDVGLCADVSKELSALLDVSDAVNGPYTLEVSSPGIERPLVRLGDFERFVGRPASIETKQPVEGRRSFKGTLLGVENGAVMLTTKNHQRIAIPRDDIKKANLVFEFRN
jgi:ribosome maturation factor RimP